MKIILGSFQEAGKRSSTKRYLVILANRQRGKFFTIYLGGFEDQGEEIFDEDVPQKVRAEHTRPGKVSNHIQEHLNQHFREIGKKALVFLIKRKFKHLDGILIGGHKEHLHLIIKYLPKKLKNKVIGEFVTDLDTSLGDLTEKLKNQFNLYPLD